MRLPHKIATASVAWWEKHVPPLALFAFVLCVLPVFLFQRKLSVLAVMTALFFLLALSRRGKVRLFPSVMMVATITCFSLLTPYGKVLFRIGGPSGFAITEGAVTGGLRRGIILAGMVFLSQLSVTKALKLPGKTGMFLAQVFSYLEALTQTKPHFKPGQIISQLDQILCQIYESPEEDKQIRQES